MSTTLIEMPETDSLQQEHAPLLSRAHDAIVTDAGSYAVVSDVYKQIVTRIRVVEDFFRPMKQSIDQAKKVVLDREKLVRVPLEVGRDRCNDLLVSYRQSEERQRVVAERQAREDAQLAEAEQREKLGDHRGAEQALNGQGVVSVSIPSSVPQVEGQSMRENWSADVIDLMALVRAIAAGTAPLACVEPCMPVLNGQARALKAQLNVPGVRAVNKPTLAQRR